MIIRHATLADRETITQLIAESARHLSREHYSDQQIDAAIATVFGVDTDLIEDGTYFVAENGKEIIACGSWSKRLAVYGGDRDRAGADTELNPARDAARVRAFFVHPNWERRGLGHALLEASETAIRAARFARIELVATLAGEPLYARFGYAVAERYDAPMPDNLTIAVVRMTKTLAHNSGEKDSAASILS